MAGRRWWKAAVAAGLGVAVLAAGSAYAVVTITAPAADGKIYSCYSTSKGTIRLVNKGKACASGERALSWNQLGPQGPAGANGSPGPQGIPGQPGPRGLSTTIYMRISGPSSVQKLLPPGEPVDETVVDTVLEPGTYQVIGETDISLTETIAPPLANGSMGCRIGLADGSANILEELGYDAGAQSDATHYVITNASYSFDAPGDKILVVPGPEPQHLIGRCWGPAPTFDPDHPIGGQYAGVMSWNNRLDLIPVTIVGAVSQ